MPNRLLLTLLGKTLLLSISLELDKPRSSKKSVWNSQFRRRRY